MAANRSEIQVLKLLSFNRDVHLYKRVLCALQNYFFFGKIQLKFVGCKKILDLRMQISKR
jgi:hypothetical protein